MTRPEGLRRNFLRKRCPFRVAYHWSPMVTKSGPFTLVHGSLRAPIWEYILDQESALGTLN